MTMRIAGLGLALAACGGGAGPELISATPPSAAASASVVVTGARLCGASGDCASAGGALDLGLDQPVRAAITAYTDTSITFTIPDVTPSGPTSLVLTVDDTASNALAFTVIGRVAGGGVQ